METPRAPTGPKHTSSFNFLASLINGNYFVPKVGRKIPLTFNFLASLINGNVAACHADRLWASFNFLASLINGNPPPLKINTQP